MTTQLETITARIAEIDARYSALKAAYRHGIADQTARRDNNREQYTLETERRKLRKEQIRLEKEAVEQTRLVIAKALEPAKIEAVEHAGKQAAKRVERARQELEKASWQLNAIAQPVSRKRFGFKNTPEEDRRAELRSWYMTFVRFDRGANEALAREYSARIWEANEDAGYVTWSPDSVTKYIENVKRGTAASFDLYVQKMAHKVGPGATACSYTGALWLRSTIKVTAPAGEQVWMTQQILNFSSLGTPYNQWPSRKVEG